MRCVMPALKARRNDCTAQAQAGTKGGGGGEGIREDVRVGAAQGGARRAGAGAGRRPTGGCEKGCVASTCSICCSCVRGWMACGTVDSATVTPVTADTLGVNCMRANGDLLP